MMQINERVNTLSNASKWFRFSQMSTNSQPAPMTMERTCFEHEHVYLEGNPKTHVYHIQEGVIGIYKSLIDGRRQIVSFGFPGDIVGLGHSENHSDSAEALNHVRLRCVSVSAIDRLMLSDPNFSLSLIQMTSVELARTREQLLSLGCQSAAEKMASFLLMILRANQKFGTTRNVFQIPIKRSDIADYLGLTVETVSRNFTKMRSSQIIELLPANEVRIIDLTKLQALSVGDSDCQ